MNEQRFPKSWHEQRVKRLIAGLDARTDEEPSVPAHEPLYPVSAEVTPAGPTAEWSRSAAERRLP
jgi:hypothetical protein